MNLDDENFLVKVEEYTSNPFQHKDDVKKIIDTVFASSKEHQFEDLTFTAKYVCGMIRVLKTAPGIPEVDSLEHVKNDLNENMKKAIEQLKEIISFGEESIQEYFTEKYFILSPQNFTNLTQLLSDLELVKKYLNHTKRQS